MIAVLTPDADADLAARGLLASLAQPDPYPAYARLRSLAPVHVPAEGPVLVTSYQAVAAVLHHGRHVGKDSDTRFRGQGLPDWRDHPGLRAMYGSMLQLDDPEHGRLRALVSSVFTPRRSEALRPTVRAVVARSVERLRERAGQPVDLVAEWAFPLPVAVIGELVGVPEVDRPGFATWVRDFAMSLEPGLGRAELAACDAAAERLTSYFHALVDVRRRAPTGDLTSALAALDGWDDDDLVRMLVLVFAAGFETTTHLLGNAVVALTRHPDQIEALRTDPSLTGNAVEELLRYDSPVQLVSRVAHSDVDLDGVRVPSGRVLYALLGAANRDPDRFPDPDRLDLRRADVRPMSFGGGPHFCLGAPLARIEAAEALPALFAAFDVALDGDPRPRPGLALHGHAAVPVRLTPRASAAGG